MQPATLGAALRALREQQGLSVRALARSLGTSRTYIRELERDETRPSPARISQLSEIFNVDSEHLALLTGRVPHDILRALQTDSTLLSAIRNNSIAR